jgi:predicted glycosyltransferase
MVTTNQIECRVGLTPETARPIATTPRVKIWIDLDNTPHVPLFIPIARELERRGHTVVFTARDAFQVCELADQKGMKYTSIGRHYGKSSVMKVAGLFWRSLQLFPFFLRERPKIALSHGARSQIVLGNLLGIPTVLAIDYEHARTLPLAGPRWEIIPDSMSADGFHCKAERILKYRGIKEDVYAPDFKPDENLLKELNLSRSDLVVTVRPPANEAHYHNPESEALLTTLMDRICQAEGVRAVMLPRNKGQEQQLRDAHPEWFANGKTIVPGRAVDGMNLLWFSDLVVSGGGTMNREAAALGVPVYSIFRGKTGAVDLKLEQEGRLIMVRSVAEVNSKIVFQRRDKNTPPENRPRLALSDIVDHVEAIIRQEYASK